ncbi:unnamed protein product [Rotaria sp. Silwood1]|nr:unnamed protein product [Rotaria sp. Silwood1]
MPLNLQLHFPAASFNEQTYTISVNSCCIETGGEISTYWTVYGRVSDQNADWIGIYKSDSCGTTVGSSCLGSPDAWSYVSSSGTSGTQIISAPSATGIYQAYYFHDNGYTIKAISKSFSISSLCAALHLTVKPETQVSNKRVIVSWCGANTSDTDDWIVFWQTDSSPSTDQNFISEAWAYTYGGTIPQNKHPTASGQCFH